MVIERKTGVILSFISSERNEIERVLKSLSSSIDAIYLKEPVLIKGSVKIIKEIKNFMTKNGIDKPIIIDYRLDQSELDYVEGLSNLLRNQGAYGMTIMAIYGEDFIRLCVNQATIEIFAIVDIGTQFFRDHFNDIIVTENATFARDNNCGGVVMASRHLDRIKKVREAVGKKFQILSTLEKESRLGDSLSVGADFEIIPHEALEK